MFLFAAKIRFVCRPSDNHTPSRRFNAAFRVRSDVRDFSVGFDVVGTTRRLIEACELGRPTTELPTDVRSSEYFVYTSRTARAYYFVAV